MGPQEIQREWAHATRERFPATLKKTKQRKINVLCPSWTDKEKLQFLINKTGLEEGEVKIMIEQKHSNL